jgi:hypothetical protein
MDRRDFVKLTPAFAAVPAVTLTAKRDDGTAFFSADLGVLRLQPGDIVVLISPSHISADTARRLGEHLEKVVPDGVKFMVLADGLEVGVLRPPSDGSA